MSEEEVTSPGGVGTKPRRLTMKANADAIADLAQTVQQNSEAVGNQVGGIISALKGIQEALGLKAQLQMTQDTERARLEAAAKTAQETARAAQQAAEEVTRALSLLIGVPPPVPSPTDKTPPRHASPRPEVTQRYHHPNHPSSTSHPAQQQAPAAAGAEDPTAVAAKIARAIQAACFAPEQGMSHPHHYITRGPEGQRIGLAKCSLGRVHTRL